MSDKYTAEQYEAMAAELDAPAYWFTAGFDSRTGHWLSGSSEGHEGENDKPRKAARMLRQVAQMMREREGKEYVMVPTGWENGEREVGEMAAWQRRIKHESGKWLSWEYFNGAVDYASPQDFPKRVGRWECEYRPLYAARRAAVPDAYLVQVVKDGEMWEHKWYVPRWGDPDPSGMHGKPYSVDGVDHPELGVYAVRGFSAAGDRT